MDNAETAHASQISAAEPGEFAPLRLGAMNVWPPVILAPMAGVTNSSFRRICRRYGAGLCISEMIAARPLSENNDKTWEMAAFAPDERPRSIQLYAVEPKYVGSAIECLVGEGLVDHVDLNFGCSVPKVTRQGGGAALPCRPRLMEQILSHAVSAARHVPVTVKFRLGLNDSLLYFIQTGRIAEGAGCAALTLHARTAEQFYEGSARWHAIGELKSRVSIPVIGNGDIWEAADGLSMMRSTGCDGVAIGRGCLGRPWLFEDLARMFTGLRPKPLPCFGEVVDVMCDHLADLIATVGEPRAVSMFRRQATWYTKGFPGSAQVRELLVRVDTFAQFRAALSALDRSLRCPVGVLRVPRGKSSRQRSVCLPDGYLQNPDACAAPSDDAWADGG